MEGVSGGVECGRSRVWVVYRRATAVWVLYRRDTLESKSTECGQCTGEQEQEHRSCDDSFSSISDRARMEP